MSSEKFPTNSQTNTAYPAPARIHFTDEQRLPWIAILMEAYFITDQGISEAIRRKEKQGQPLACAQGCASCCQSHESIPVYPLELMGMSWYAIEQLEGEQRDQLKQQLSQLETHDACPFLLNNSCSIHAVRPMACRSFNVFNTPCKAGEDAYYTRREDVLTPLKKYQDDAFDIMLPFYGVKTKAERRKMIKTGAQHQMAKVMRDMNWSSLVEKMQAFEQK